MSKRNYIIIDINITIWTNRYMENIKEFIETVLLSTISIGNLELPFNLLNLLLRLIIPVVIIFFVFKIFKRGLSALVNRSKAKDENKKAANTWIRRGINIIYYILVIVLVANLLGAETMKYLGMIYEVLNQPIIESGQTRITIITIILTIPVFYIGSWVGKTIKRMVSKDLLDRMGFDKSKQFSFTSIIQYGVMIIIVLIGLSVIGIDLSALTLIFGVLGIGLGFGLQKIVSNIIAGLIIIFSRPVKEGDRITINGFEGTVTQIRLNSTNITTMTNENIIVPNSNFVENVVHNYSYENREIVIKNKVQISYGDDPEIALKILEEIGKDCPYSLKNPPPVARFKGFGDSGLDLSLFTWITDLQYKFDAHDHINRMIWRKFRDNNISIPFPHVYLIHGDKKSPDKEDSDKNNQDF